MIEPLPIPMDILTTSLRKIFGSRAGVSGFYALPGGSRKKVFHLNLPGRLPDVVLLVWQNEMDYFGERDNPDSIRSDQQAPLLYRANTELLVQRGLRVPELYFFDSSREQVPFAFALVEYLKGKSINEWRIDRSAPEAQTLLFKVRDYLSRLHSIQRQTYGTVLDNSPKVVPCYGKVLGEAYSDLQFLGDSIEVVRQNESRVRDVLNSLCEQIQPRNRYRFIHDELGPDEHLMVGENGEIGIIDLDGCHFFDLEREHSYLKIRFGEDYDHLKRDDLDDARMKFYSLCIHISAAYGHYRLYKKGFPDPGMLRSIFELNIHKLVRISQGEWV